MRDIDGARPRGARVSTGNADVLHHCAFLHGAVYITRQYKAA